MPTINCATSLKNISLPNCFVKYGALFALWVDPTNTGIADSATALLEATWTGKINSSEGSRMRILKNPDNVEWENEDIPFIEGNMKKRKKLRAGNRRAKITWNDLDVNTIERFQSLDGYTGYAYIVTDNKYIIAGSEDDTKITPVEVEIFVDNPIQPNGKDELWAFDVYVDFINPDDMNKKALAPASQTSGAWNPKDLDGIVDVEFTEVSASASSVVVEANGAVDDREVTGFVAGDFDVTGLASISASGNTYTLTPTTTFTSPLVIKLKDQPTMTTKGYETDGDGLTVAF